MSKVHRYTGPRIATQAPTFNKIFRWEPANPQNAAPTTVEVAGSFSEWQPLPLKKDRAGNGWQLAVNNIPGNCTHRYMLLVDGQPVNDPHADGLAIPETAQEKERSLMTARGLRLFILFSQTK